MTQPIQPTQQEPLKAKRGGNPILRTLKETGKLPEGYYLDDKKRLRKVLPGEGPNGPERTEEVEFDRLKAMKHVLGNPASTDKTPGEKACRKWLEKNPGPFMETLDKLESAQKNGIPEDMPGEAPVEVTESDEEVKSQIRELIRKHTGKK